MREKEHADDWVWIIDHTIQFGVEKCLLILGTRLSNFSDDRDKILNFEDMEPILLSPVKKSTGEIVMEQLEEATKMTGVPREIIADNGSDLKKGIECFCKKHPKTSYIYDIKHKTAALLKREFEKDEKFNEFKKLALQTKNKIRQTEYAFLINKNIRAKARYMNIDILIQWGQNTIEYMDRKQPLSADLKEKFDWILEYREALMDWGDTIAIIKTVESHVRKKGIYPLMNKELKEFMDKKRITRKKTAAISKALFQFLEMESLKAQLKEKLLGSSEVIESTFGKLKYLEKDHSRCGFTSLILSVGAFVSKTSQSIVKKALETVSVKNIRDWCEENLGKTLQSKKKSELNMNINTEQKPDQFYVAA